MRLALLHELMNIFRMPLGLFIIDVPEYALNYAQQGVYCTHYGNCSMSQRLAAKECKRGTVTTC